MEVCVREWTMKAAKRVLEIKVGKSNCKRMLLSSKKIIFNVALECHPPVVFALQQWTQWKAKTNSTFNCWIIDKTGRENKCQVQPRALRQSAFTIIIVREVIRFRLVQVWKSRSWTLIMLRLSWNASECRDKMFLHEEKKKPAICFLSKLLHLVLAAPWNFHTLEVVYFQIRSIGLRRS